MISAWMLVAMIAMEFGGAFGVLESKFPVSPFTAMWLFASAIAVLRIAQEPGSLARVSYIPIIAMVCYVFGLVVSVRTSNIPLAVGTEGITQGVKDFSYFVVMSILTMDIRCLRSVSLAIAAPCALIGSLCALNVFVLGPSATFGGFVTATTDLGVGTDIDRMAGPLTDSNFWGRFLVIALMFAYALVINAATKPQRIVAFALISGITLGIYTTGSRGTFLASTAATGLFLLLVKVPIRRMIVGMAILVPMLLLVPGVGSRLGSIGGLVSSNQQVSVDASIQLRLAAQEVAALMFQSQPFTGVGVGGYPAGFNNYVAAAGLQVDRFIAPHNVYLEKLSETGVVGLTTWLILVSVGLAGALHACRLYSPSSSDLAASRLSRDELLASRAFGAALAAGIVGWLLASVFLHLSYFRVLLILIALSGALQERAIREVRFRPRPLVKALPDVRFLTVPVLCGAMGLGMITAMKNDWTATQIAYGKSRLDDQYAESIARSGVLLTTYALILQSRDSSVNAQGDSRSGSITVTVKGETEETARTHLERVVADGQVDILRAQVPEAFRLEWTPVEVFPSGPTAVWQGIGAGGGFAVGSLVAWAWVRPRRQRLWNSNEWRSG